jgi:transcriptional regulator GlxA family with amidase domain
VPVDDDRFAAVLDWAAQRLDRQITVDTWAEQACMSPRTFTRRFRASTGTTPRQWLIDQRVQTAQRLLEGTGMPVEYVAGAVGFGSADALRHQMAARRGTTPSEHRRASRRRQSKVLSRRNSGTERFASSGSPQPAVQISRSCCGWT